MKSDEQKIYEQLLDELSIDDALGEFSDVPVSEDLFINDDTLNRIREKTFRKLNLNQEHSYDSACNETKRLNKKWKINKWKIGVAVAVLTLFVSVVYSPQLRAQIMELIHFVPGIGTVSVENEQGDYYVLSDHVNYVGEDVEIELRGMLVTPEKSQIVVFGTTPKTFSFTIENEYGEKYNFENIAMSSTQESWKGTFQNEGVVVVTNKMKLIYDDDVIFFNLNKSVGVTSFEELGATMKSSEIKLTAIKEQDDFRNRITLVPNHASNIHIESYGLKKNQLIQSPYFTNEKGEKMNINIEQDLLSGGNQFSYNKIVKESDVYLNVPELLVRKTLSKPVDLKVQIPKENSALVGGKIEIDDAMVEIKEIERLDEKTIKLNVSVDGTSSVSDKLVYFFPSNFKSVNYTLDKNKGTMESMILEVAENKNEITLEIDEVYSILKGPWVMELK
ncbi:hypothetical protein V6669_05035 [Paenibacillus sp. Y5S-9]|uniref:hypothetical protein n=1 Tax=Paenibacillus sp. Y5S-9 TaxID=3122489 RepID=UPI0030D385EC